MLEARCSLLAGVAVAGNSCTPTAAAVEVGFGFYQRGVGRVASSGYAFQFVASAVSEYVVYRVAVEAFHYPVSSGIVPIANKPVPFLYLPQFVVYGPAHVQVFFLVSGQPAISVVSIKRPSQRHTRRCTSGVLHAIESVVCQFALAV